MKDIEAVVPVAVGKASIGFAFRLEIRNQQAVYMAALSDDIRSQWISEIYKLISHNRPEPPQRQLSSYHIPVSDIRIEPSTTVASVNPIEGRKADWLGTTVAVKTLPGIPLIPFISGDIEALQYVVLSLSLSLSLSNVRSDTGGWLMQTASEYSVHCQVHWHHPRDAQHFVRD